MTAMLHPQQQYLAIFFQVLRMTKHGCNVIFHHSSRVLGRPAFILVQNPIGEIHIM